MKSPKDRVHEIVGRVNVIQITLVNDLYLSKANHNSSLSGGDAPGSIFRKQITAYSSTTKHLIGGRGIQNLIDLESAVLINLLQRGIA